MFSKLSTKSRIEQTSERRGQQIAGFVSGVQGLGPLLGGPGYLVSTYKFSYQSVAIRTTRLKEPIFIGLIRTLTKLIISTLGSQAKMRSGSISSVLQDSAFVGAQKTT